jgi:hypothetical protein
MPRFLVEEVTVRESGESTILPLEANGAGELVLALEISHVKQQQELDVCIFSSEDGVKWATSPVAAFLAKQHCGSYRLGLPDSCARFLKAVWRVNSRGCNPLFRFCLRVEQVGIRTMAGAA